MHRMESSSDIEAVAILESPTLAVNQALKARQAAGERILNLGFGEAGLPVLPEVREVLAQAAGHNQYGPVAGSEAARAAAASWFGRHGLSTSPEQILLAPGSKALLFAVFASFEGDVILPTPCWVSYAAQAALVGRRVLSIPALPGMGGAPDPEALATALRNHHGQELRGALLVMTAPDNPTGTIPSPGLVHQVCEIADRHDLVIVSDEIYRDLAFVPGSVTSPATLLPERTVVTGGLSKSMALGGWRIGFARFPSNRFGERLRASSAGIASEVWSCLASPMQQVAAWVLKQPPVVAEHIASSRLLHQRVVAAVHHEFEAVGADCAPAAGGFYIYPSLERSRAALSRLGVSSGSGLAAWLLEEQGVGVLAGSSFGDDPAALRFRVATSLLYGATEAQRWEALRSGDPLRLPWIDDSLAHLRQALRALTAS